MMLNNNAQMFTIYFPSNFFYTEVKEIWEPYILRLRLPFESIEDFMNAQIQTVTFPSLDMETASQQIGQYQLIYPGGKEVEPIAGKNLNITFKLTESYYTYWIMYYQITYYLQYQNKGNKLKNQWMEPINISFLNDAGFEILKFKFKEITPIGLSELNLSYAATIAQYTTFNFSLNYNRFDIE